MMFSFSATIQEAKNENEANDQIQKINQVLFCENFNNYVGSYSLNGIFEADEIEDFTKSLQESLIQFAKEYKEKCEKCIE